MTDNLEVGFGQLKQQVVGLQEGHNQLRNEFHVLDQKMDRGFAEISKKLDAKTTPQWPAYAILVTVILAIGGALYYPVRETMTRQDEATRRLWENQNKTALDLSYLRGQLNPLKGVQP